jgi:hypothetical protein
MAVSVHSMPTCTCKASTTCQIACFFHPLDLQASVLGGVYKRCRTYSVVWPSCINPVGSRAPGGKGEPHLVICVEGLQVVGGVGDAGVKLPP